MAELHQSNIEPEDDKPTVVEMLPIVMRRFEVTVAGEGENAEENEWGITVPHTRLDVPDLDLDPEYLAGARMEVSKLPGAGKYEILFVYTLLTDKVIERRERREAKLQAAFLMEEDPYLEEDDDE